MLKPNMRKFTIIFLIISFLLLACAPREGYVVSNICQDSTYLVLKSKGYLNLTQEEKDLYIVLNDSCHNQQLKDIGGMSQEAYDASSSYVIFILLVAGIIYFFIK